MGTKHVVPRAEGQGGIGTATLGWGELFITNTTNDSATQGGKLTLTSNDGAAMQSGSRLGVIEFKGAESDSALTIGARIEAICDAVWSATENGASLKFYTTDANASESLVLTLDSNKLAVFSGAVAITGNLTVNGTTTTVNSTIVTIDDPVFTLGGDTAPVSETTQDKGIEFRYHTGSAAKIGFFGWDDSASAFTFIPDATNNSEVFSGTAGNAIFTNITGTLQTAAQTNITSVGALNGGTITSGFGAINNGASAITTTGLISGGSLDIDNVLINGTTIGHTDDTDLMTLADGVLTVAGELDAVSLDISGNADIDGTLEADAITVNGTALNTVIAGVTVTNATNAATVTGAAQGNITSLGTLTTLTVDNVVVNGTTIGHTSDTDLMTLASGALTVAGNVNVGSTLSVQASSNLATLELIGRTGSGFGGGLLAKSSIYSETSGSQYSANLVFKTNNGSNSLTERLRLNYNGDAIFSGEIEANEMLKITQSSAGSEARGLKLANTTGSRNWNVTAGRYNQNNDDFTIRCADTNVDALYLSPTGAATFSGNITVGDSHFVGDDSYDNLLIQSSSGENINISSANDVIFYTGGTSPSSLGTQRLRIFNSDGAATFSGTIIPSSTDSIRKSVNNSLITISGGNATNAGANYSLFGGTHSTLPNIHRWRIGASEVMRISSLGHLKISNSENWTAANNTEVIGHSALEISPVRGGTNNSLCVVPVSGNLPAIQSIDSVSNNVQNLPLNPFGGNVGIGTNSPVTKLNISNPSASTGSAAAGRLADSSLHFDDTTHVGRYSQITFGYPTSNTHASAYVGYVSTSSSASGKGDLVFGTKDNTAYNIQPTERMRISAGGDVRIDNNVGIGTGAYSTQRLTVINSSVFANAGTDGGNSYVGTQPILSVSTDGNGVASGNYANNNIFVVGIGGAFASPSGQTTTKYLRIQLNGKLYYSFTSAGGSVNDVTYNPSTKEVYYISSSRRYKENIKDYNKSTLDNVLKLKVKTFDYINGNGIDQVGLIAEEVNEHIPELVPKMEVEGFDEPQPNSVRYSQLSVFLLKAIQEQQTIIEDLKSRIETLEG